MESNYQSKSNFRCYSCIGATVTTSAIGATMVTGAIIGAGWGFCFEFSSQQWQHGCSAKRRYYGRSHWRLGCLALVVANMLSGWTFSDGFDMARQMHTKILLDIMVTYESGGQANFTKSENTPPTKGPTLFLGVDVIVEIFNFSSKHNMI